MVTPWNCKFDTTIAFVQMRQCRVLVDRLKNQIIIVEPLFNIVCDFGVALSLPEHSLAGLRELPF